MMIEIVMSHCLLAQHIFFLPKYLKIHTKTAKTIRINIKKRITLQNILRQSFLCLFNEHSSPAAVKEEKRKKVYFNYQDALDLVAICPIFLFSSFSLFFSYSNATTCNIFFLKGIIQKKEKGRLVTDLLLLSRSCFCIL